MKLMLLFFIFWNIQSGKAIIGGKEVIPNQYPWVLDLFINLEKGWSSCGASLISKKHALTAAHCVFLSERGSIKNMEITAGEHSLIQNENSEKKIKVCKFKIHPQYYIKYYNPYKSVDLAILEFCDPIEFNEHIQPIELAHPKLNIWKYGRPIVTTAGWGKTENSKKLSPKLRAITQKIRTLSHEVCEYLFSPFDPCSLYTWLAFIKNYIFTVDDYSGTNSGDSGGPLWWKDPETHKIYQVGVTSAGKNFGKRQLMSLKTAINKNYQWIMDNIN